MISLAALALILALAGSHAMSLKGCDECFYAQIAHDMARTGDWLTPRFAGVPVFDKPPLLFWLGALAGPSAFAARLPSLLAGLLAVALAYMLVRRERDDADAGGRAGMVFATTVALVLLSHQVMTDVLALAAIAALALGVLGLPRDARWGWLVGPALGALILAKGALAALVLLAFGPYLVRHRPALRRPLALGLVAGLAPAVAWYAAMDQAHGGVFWAAHLGVHVVERATSGLHGSDPLGPAFYLVNGLWLFLPWTPLVPWAVAAAWRRARAGDGLATFALGFTAVFGVAISLAATRFHHYALPLALPVAIVVGDWLGQTPRRAKAGTALAWGLAITFALASPFWRPWDLAPGLAAAMATVPGDVRPIYVGPPPDEDFCTMVAVHHALDAPPVRLDPASFATAGPGWYLGRDLVLAPGDRLASDVGGWRLLYRPQRANMFKISGE